MKKNLWLFFILALLISSALKASPNEAESVLNVTKECYCDFLNSTAISDLHDLYDVTMALEQDAIMRAGTPGHYFYFVCDKNKNELIHNVSYKNQLRFCNWIENGRPENSLGTETGAYDVTTFEKNPAALCALADEKIHDPFLKINKTIFCIIGPVSLLGSGSTLLLPKLNAGEEFIPFEEEIGNFFWLLVFAAGAEGAHGLTQDQASAEHRTPELEERRQVSETVPRIPANVAAEEIANGKNHIDASVGKRFQFLLARWKTEAQANKGLAEEQSKTFAATLEEALLKQKELNEVTRKIIIFEQRKAALGERLEKVKQALEAHDASFEEAIKNWDWMTPGFSAYLINTRSFVFIQSPNNKTLQEAINEKHACWKKNNSKLNKANRYVSALSNEYDKIDEHLKNPEERKRLFQKIRQEIKNKKQDLINAQTTFSKETEKLETLEEVTKEVTAIVAMLPEKELAAIVPMLQEAAEQLKSKLQSDAFVSFWNKSVNRIIPLSNIKGKLSQATILEIIERKIKNFQAKINSGDEAHEVFDENFDEKVITNQQPLINEENHDVLKAASTEPLQVIESVISTDKEGEEHQKEKNDVSYFLERDRATSSTSTSASTRSSNDGEDDHTISSNSETLQHSWHSITSCKTATTIEYNGSNIKPPLGKSFSPQAQSVLALNNAKNVSSSFSKNQKLGEPRNGSGTSSRAKGQQKGKAPSVRANKGSTKFENALLAENQAEEAAKKAAAKQLLEKKHVATEINNHNESQEFLGEGASIPSFLESIFSSIDSFQDYLTARCNAWEKKPGAKKIEDLRTQQWRYTNTLTTNAKYFLDSEEEKQARLRKNPPLTKEEENLLKAYNEKQKIAEAARVNF